MARLSDGVSRQVVSSNRNYTRDGRVIHCTWYNSVLLDEQGQMASVQSLVLDITERKAAEQALEAAMASAQQAKAAAEQASKAKDHFLAVLSHELRNPLNPVLATASMLRDDPRFDADTHEQLEIICRNAELEARLIDDLLDVTRIERGKIELHREPLDLGTIIRHAAEVCMPDIEGRELEFGINLPDGPYVIDADPVRLQQVIWNLLNNAIKFTPKGGCVGIRCRRDAEGCVVAQVSDSGEGIEAGVLPRLFNAFEQGGRKTTRQFGGLGLGLAISRSIAQLHGGTLTADSEGKGQGATFTLCLPLLPAEITICAIDPAGPAPGAVTAPLRILLVEDHGDTARVMRRLLCAQGHQVHNAADVAMALKLVDEHPFDLLLSDLGLPDGSGLDLMRTLRQRGQTLPGIALSGYGQEQDIQQSHDAGFAAHLVKPVDLPRLKEAIARAVGQGG
jgi:two-component system CheB/CheR fusion protein